MTSPRHRYTLISACFALMLGWLTMPALAVVKVTRACMGIEHEQFWRRAPLSIMAALAMLRTRAAGFLSRLHVKFVAVRTHALFEPFAAALAVIVFVLHAHVAMAAPFVLGALTEGQHAGEFIMGERPDGGSRESVTVLSGQNLKAGAVVGRVSRGIGRISVPTVVGTGNGTVSQVFAGPDVQVGSYVVKCTVLAANGGTFSVTAPDGNLLPNFVMAAGGGGQAVTYRGRHINFKMTDGGTDFAVNDTFTFVVDTTAPTVQGGTGTGTLSALALGPDAEPGNYRLICVTAVANGGVFQLFRGGPDGGISLGQYTMTPGAGAATIFESRHFTFTITDNADFIVGNFFDVCVFNQLSGGKAVAWDPTTFDGSHIVAGILLDNVNATASDLAGTLIGRDAVVQKTQLQWAAAITAGQKAFAYSDLYKRGIIAR